MVFSVLQQQSLPFNDSFCRPVRLFVPLHASCYLSARPRSRDCPLYAKCHKPTLRAFSMAIGLLVCLSNDTAVQSWGMSTRVAGGLDGDRRSDDNAILLSSVRS